MSEIVHVTVFAFDELSDEAKSSARDTYRASALDYPWYEAIYNDFETVCALLGVRLQMASVPLMGGGRRPKPSIYFSGFWSQGDGACFEGVYRYQKGSVAAVQTHAPLDSELLQIARTLREVQHRNFFQLVATAIHRGRYCHEYTMVIDVDRNGFGQYPSADAEDTVKEALRDLARWLYRQLEREYEHLTSDAVIDDVLASSDYRFTAAGTVFG